MDGFNKGMEWKLLYTSLCQDQMVRAPVPSYQLHLQERMVVNSSKLNVSFLSLWKFNSLGSVYVKDNTAI